jgi:hypothetical protein
MPALPSIWFRVGRIGPYFRELVYGRRPGLPWYTLASWSGSTRRRQMRNVRKILPPARDLKAIVARSRGAVITLALCLVLMVVAIYFATTIYSDLPLTGAGLIAMIVGVIATLAIGIGLMALIFYSSRAGYDEPPEIEHEDDGDKSAGR